MTAALDWQESAVCRSVDPELFFPEHAGPSHEAKRVCAECPVRAECLADALAHRDRYGIWGGLTDRERRRLIPRPGRGHGRRPVPQHGTESGYRAHYRRDERACEPCRRAANAAHQERARRRRVVAPRYERGKTVDA
jgi:WhiB family redox-sensing transcriptional regulator